MLRRVRKSTLKQYNFQKLLSKKSATCLHFVIFTFKTTTLAKKHNQI